MKNDVNHISLITKIRAMEGRLLTEYDYNNIYNMNSIGEIYSYLSENRVYQESFAEHESRGQLHRNQLERMLEYSEFKDFIKLYKFATGEERRFLDIIAMQFETNILKRCIASLNSKNKNTNSYIYKSFLKKHSNIDFNKVGNAKTINELVIMLNGTRYYKLLSSIIKKGYTKLADFETKLDLFYYTKVWEDKHKFNKDIEEIISFLVGTEIDLYNIKNIFRCKCFYKMQPNEIREYLVDINYKLKKKELSSLIDATTLEEFYEIFNRCYYARLGILFDLESVDASFGRALNELHGGFIKKHPESLARVYVFFDKKNYEISYTTKLIEQVRYKKNSFINER